jgi:hypothetical protein
MVIFLEVNDYTYQKDWFWNYKLNSLSEEELLKIYTYCKNSWK